MTRRDKDPFDELFKKMLEDFFGGTRSTRGMGTLFDEVSEVFGNIDQEDFRKALNEKREYSSEKPFHFGFSVRKSPSGETRINTFGDDVESKEREPLVDVFEEEDNVLVTAEIPGIEEEDIEIEVRDKELLIEADGETNSYSKKVDLPEKVEEESLKREYKNGVLSLKFKKK